MRYEREDLFALQSFGTLPLKSDTHNTLPILPTFTEPMFFRYNIIYH